MRLTRVSALMRSFVVGAACDDRIGDDGLSPSGHSDVFDRLEVAPAMPVEGIREHGERPGRLIRQGQVFRPDLEALIGLPGPAIQFQGRVVRRSGSVGTFVDSIGCSGLMNPTGERR